MREGAGYAYVLYGGCQQLKQQAQRMAKRAQLHEREPPVGQQTLSGKQQQGLSTLQLWQSC